MRLNRSTWARIALVRAVSVKSISSPVAHLRTNNGLFAFVGPLRCLGSRTGPTLAKLRAPSFGEGVSNGKPRWKTHAIRGANAYLHETREVEGLHKLDGPAKRLLYTPPS